MLHVTTQSHTRRPHRDRPGDSHLPPRTSSVPAFLQEVGKPNVPCAQRTTGGVSWGGCPPPTRSTPSHKQTRVPEHQLRAQPRREAGTRVPSRACPSEALRTHSG